LWDSQWYVSGASDIDHAHHAGAETTFVGWIAEEVLRERGVQIEYGVAIEPDGVRLLDEQLDRCLVVQDRLGLGRVLPLSLLAELNKVLCVQARVAVPSSRLDAHARSISKRPKISRAYVPAGRSASGVRPISCNRARSVLDRYHVLPGVYVSRNAAS